MTLEVHQPSTSLVERMDYARAVAVAPLLPEAFRSQPANILIAMEVADALEMRPYMVMQEMSVIGGRPAFSAKFMRGLVRRAGHRLRESFEGGVARCVIIRTDDPEFEHVATWDQAKAERHGYWGKGHWSKNPELMLKNRAVSECVREACPEVLGGVAYTPDEVDDFAPQQHRSEQRGSAPRKLTAEIVRGEPAPESEAADMVADHQDAAVAHVVNAVADTIEGQPTADGITDAQIRKLGAQTKKLGLADRTEFLAFVGRVVGREVQSRADLTKTEASGVIEALTLWETDGADPTTGLVEDQPTEDVVDAEVVGGDPWAVQS